MNLNIPMYTIHKYIGILGTLNLSLKIMQLLKKRILQDGKCYEGGILKVDSFINHQMDQC